MICAEECSHHPLILSFFFHPVSVLVHFEYNCLCYLYQVETLSSLGGLIHLLAHWANFVCYLLCSILIIKVLVCVTILQVAFTLIIFGKFRQIDRQIWRHNRQARFRLLQWHWIRRFTVRMLVLIRSADRVYGRVMFAFLLFNCPLVSKRALGGSR